MRRECAAVYAASAYTCTSGKMAVVGTNAGPGVRNTPAGKLEADSMNITILQIGGAFAMSKRHAGDLRDMSRLALMESCCKWAKENYQHRPHSGAGVHCLSSDHVCEPGSRSTWRSQRICWLPK